MWKYSRGITFASPRAIVEHELEVALALHFPHITPLEFNVLGYGVEHAFGEMVSTRFPEPFEDIVEMSILTGKGPAGMASPPFRHSESKEQFAKHLEGLSELRKSLPASKLDDALYAISIADIIQPLNRIAYRHNLPGNALETMGRTGLIQLVDSMPTRRLDVHLHRQMLRNPNIKVRLTDLEDWAGLGAAVQYCDYVVCEKHFADLIKRDGFRTKASVGTDLEVLNEILDRF